MRTVRIFISSPGDVQDERQKARQVVEQLQRRYAGRLKLVPVLWEDLPLQADMSFQQGIDLVLSDEQGVDIAVFILWSRLGSPLGALVRKTDGTPYRSGTEREFDLMVQAREQSGGRKPTLLAYVRQDEAGFKRVLSDQALPDLESLLQQRRLVDQFIQERFHDSASGANVRAYHTFQEPVTFATRLREHLRQKLDELLPEQARPETPWEAEPFRGLEVFELEHHSIFFGREQAVCDLQVALREQAAAGSAFVLIVGASGSGKSSLARAGVLSAFIHENLDPAVSAWRWGILLPGAHAQNLCQGLAQTLAADQALPELREDDPSLSELAEALAESPEMAFKLRIKGAFKKASRGGPGEVRLLLLVDQLEELFTHPEVTPAAITAFLQALQALARSGAVWILATVRSDFYARCQAFPTLTALKQGQGTYDLLPPGPAEMQRIITEPVCLAGLRYERKADTEESLDQRILNDAVKHPEALPLLEYLLRELYQRRSADGVLTFVEYEKLGGVEGALGTRAEAVFAGLAADAQMVLPEVLNALVTVSEEDENAVVRQRAPMDSLTDTPAKRTLVDEFLRQRLFIADQAAGGTAVVHVAHEALLRGWGRARQWAAENRDFLRARRRVTQAQARWRAEGRTDDFLLPEGKPLAEAEALLRSREAWLPVEVREYIRASAKHWEAQRERQVRRLRLAVAGFAVLALVAMMGGWVAWKQKTRAEAAEVAANLKERTIGQNLARVDFLKACEKLDQNRPDVALAYLARGMSLDHDSAENQTRAFTLLTQRQWPRLVRQFGREKQSHAAHFSLDGRWVVTTTAKEAQVWEATTGKPIGTSIPQHEGRNLPIRFSPDGRWVVIATEERTIQVQEVTTGRAVSEPIQHKGRVVSAEFSPNSRWVVSVSEEPGDGEVGTAQVWEAASGKPVSKPIKHQRYVYSAHFSPDGRWIVTASGDHSAHRQGGQAQVWDAETGKLISEPMIQDTVVRSAEFSPDGRCVLTTSLGTAQVWESVTAKRVGITLACTGNAAHFSPDGRWVVTASDDKTVQVWEVATGKALGEPMQHKESVVSAEFSPHGRWVVTASGNYSKNSKGNLRVWDAASGKSVSEPMRHEERVESAEFSPNERWILAASGSLWELPCGSATGNPMRHEDAVRSAGFSPDGRWVVTASGDKTARVWDAASGKPVGHPMNHQEGVTSAEFSPDGHRVVTVSGVDQGGTARVWEAATGKPLIKPIECEAAIFPVRFSPDGRWVVTASGDKTARVWEASTGKLVNELVHHGIEIFWPEFSPDGRWVITAQENKAARVWETSTGKPVSDPMRHEDEVCSAHFSPNGHWVVTASGDKTARIWEAATGTPVGEPMQHEDIVLSAVFSPDGLWVTTESVDNPLSELFGGTPDVTVQVWEAATRKPVSEPMPLKKLVWSTDFSPNGRWVVTPSPPVSSEQEGAAMVWEAATGKPLCDPLQHAKRVWSAHFSPDGRWVVTASEDHTARIWPFSILPQAGSSPDPTPLVQLALYCGGCDLNERTSFLRQLTMAERLELRTKAASFRDDPLYGPLVRWILDPPETRPVFPLPEPRGLPSTTPPTR